MRVRFVGLMLFALVFAARAQGPEPQFTVQTDIQYCTGGGVPLLMDVFIPTHRNSTPTPAVLWIHGGGWAMGDKNGNSGAKFLANEGFVTASLSYRLSGESPFPAAIEDCKCAIRFLRKNALNYGINSDRIGVAGSSAGGHLAELVATTSPNAGLEGAGGWQNVSSKVQAAASYYGVSDFTAQFPRETDQFIEKFLRGTESEKAQLYRKASPIFYVSKDDPPLLIVHGDKDDVVPFEQSTRMIEAYRRIGLSVEFIAVLNSGHDFEQIGSAPISPSVEIIHQRTVDFFKRHLISVPATANRSEGAFSETR